MFRKLNSIIQDYIRKQKVFFARKLWDKKIKQKIIISNKFIESNNIKSILIMRDDGKIGDMVVNTLMFREIKKRHPNIKIGVVTRGAAIDIIKNNIFIDKIYEYKKNYRYLKKLSKEIEKEKYDLLIDFSLNLREHQIMFINNCKAKINIGINKRDWKLFDISVDKTNGHITNRYKKILSFLGIDSENIFYDIQLDERVEEEIIKRYTKDIEYVVLNPFAASKYRNLNFDNIIRIVKMLLEYTNNFVYIIGEEKHKDNIEKVLKSLNSDRVRYIKLKNIQEVATVIKYSQLVITPDTSIVHIAVAFNKKLISIYRQDNGDENSITWGPNSNKSIQIFSQDKTPFGIESDINKIDLKEIEKELAK